MEGYGYAYPPPFPQMRLPDGEYPDHGDGIGEYYGLDPLSGEQDVKRYSRSKHRRPKKRDTKKSRPRSKTTSNSRSRSLSQSRSRSHSRSRSRTRSRTPSGSRTRSQSGSRKELNLKEPGILDAFRVLYLTPSKHKKSTTKYLATKKRQDRVQEILKSDGLGSKKWLFYPRSQNRFQTVSNEASGARVNCDQRVKVDGDFFRKYKKSKKVDIDAPIAKLKRWELVFYKKLGFIQAI